MEMEPDIENMTLNEYFEYEAEKERRLWRNVRSKSSPTRYEGADFTSSHRDKSITLDFPHYYEDASMVKKDSDFDEILDDLFRIGAENLRRMGQEKVQNGCNVDTSRDTNHESGDEILNVTMVDEEADFNPTKDIEELERLITKNRQSHFKEIQVHSFIVKPEPFIHTQPMSPLYGVIKSSQSSMYPYKVDRDITSPECKEMGFEITSNRNYVVKVLLSTVITV
ncbi:hypothetical protein Tco_1189478 [Tanacetum coccineum]